jgi:hypothetical protein
MWDNFLVAAHHRCQSSNLIVRLPLREVQETDACQEIAGSRQVAALSQMGQTFGFALQEVDWQSRAGGLGTRRDLISWADPWLCLRE